MTRTPARLRSLFALACSMAGLAGCSFGPREWVEAQERFELPGEGVARIEASTHNGAIEVQGRAETGPVRVSVRKKAGGSDLADAEEALANVEIVRERKGEVLELGWRWRECQTGWGAVVSFEVEAPRALAVQLQSHNGRLVAKGMQGPTRMTTHNGGARVEESGAEVRVETHNGEVDVSGALRKVDAVSYNGRVKVWAKEAGPVDGSLVTHNGGVSVELAEGVSTRVEAKTHNGSVRPAERFQGQQESWRRYTGTLGDGKGRLEATTYNGSIDLR